MLHGLYDDDYSLSNILVNHNSSLYISEPFSDFKNNSLAQLIHVADKLFPLFSINISYATQILETAYNSVHAQYSIEDAVAWAGGFVMPLKFIIRTSMSW